MITYQLLSKAQIEQIQSLQEIVIAGLQDETILQPLSREELETILNGQGKMLGAFKENRLIACRALLQPSPLEEEHLGIDAKVQDLTRVLYQEVSFVHPEFRGQGLQRKLGEEIMKTVDYSQYDVICATVKPFNIPSLKDKFAQDMKVVALKLKYGGKLRYVFAKNLTEKPVVYTQEKQVHMRDTELQQKLLANGYVGTALTKILDHYYVIYKK